MAFVKPTNHFPRIHRHHIMPPHDHRVGRGLGPCPSAFGSQTLRFHSFFLSISSSCLLSLPKGRSLDTTPRTHTTHTCLHTTKRLLAFFVSKQEVKTRLQRAFNEDSFFFCFFFSGASSRLPCLLPSSLGAKLDTNPPFHSQRVFSSSFQDLDMHDCVCTTSLFPLQGGSVLNLRLFQPLGHVQSGQATSGRAPESQKTPSGARISPPFFFSPSHGPCTNPERGSDTLHTPGGLSCGPPPSMSSLSVVVDPTATEGTQDGLSIAQGGMRRLKTSVEVQASSPHPQ